MLSLDVMKDFTESLGRAVVYYTGPTTINHVTNLIGQKPLCFEIFCRALVLYNILFSQACMVTF